MHSEPHKLATPSDWVVRFAPRIPAGRVLDLACGSGRHTLLLAGAGHNVVSVDRDAAALASLVSSAALAHPAATASPCSAGQSAPTKSAGSITTRCIDLEAAGAPVAALLQPASFAGIVVTNYLHRPLLPQLFSALIEGGILIYETFAAGNAAFGKPSNPDFLLRRGELLAASAAAPCGMQVLAFEDDYVALPKPAMLQRLCAVRTGAAVERAAIYQ